MQSVYPHEHVLVSQKEANPDLFSYDQAMNSEHRPEWIKASKKEFNSSQQLTTANN